MSLPLLLRRPALRWLVPLAVLAGIAGSLVVPRIAGATPDLPTRTPQQLLASLASADRHPFSGTVVETAKLGLPPLPDLGQGVTLQSLVSGSHTVRAWYADPEHARLSLVGQLAQSDVVRSGRDVWTWSSQTREVTHVVLPAHATPDKASDVLPATPPALASQLLAALTPTTAVTVVGADRIAGRTAYELVLAPKDPAALVGQVRLAVDARTSLPLRVRVYARGASTPAIQVAFTSVRFGKPAAAALRFSPPPGSKVHLMRPEAAAGTASAMPTAKPRAAAPVPTHAFRGGDAAQTSTGPRVVGQGWTTVAVLPAGSLPTSSAGRLVSPKQAGPSAGSADTAAVLARLLGATTPVSGTFGSGRLLRTPLVSVLLLDDGRTLVGAVTPERIEAVAASLASR